ncbi:MULTISPECIES: PP2C family serine/threonine-protein phosphatase [unclassified Nocardioides]|uniref:PP2C family serine/threonine-protein phosphatase n=1 Tax=unclassified Nocardioides TaxID=2615069 RepID=UPI00114D86B2|nr:MULTISPECIES: zinc-ribbon domain-containing protein [unclassified Nocardioides]TQK72164.1 serine/threonine protein phosphatase PrpC [Nocardioides sp. SLBN-35]WGY03622.1 zinc ribbon domain-containing protein [Nocardioides sp. QY071]
MNCPSCQAAIAPGARFCENCGAQVGAPAAAPVPAAAAAADHPLGDAPISAPTRKPASALPDPPAPAGRRPCTECGGEVGPDLYCLECGTKAPSERDHFQEQPAPWVAGVCDKAIGKNRNEDAMALLAGAQPGGQPGSRAVLIVMDGVSNSIDSDVASLAGARAAREVLRMPLPAGMGTPESRDAAVRKVFTDAAAAANTAIVAVTDPDSPNPASATFTTAVLEGRRITWANIGDSRSYWLPDEGTPVQLTVDDSVAQAQIASGVAREIAETGPQAHAITKWLGRDSEDQKPTIGALDVDRSGWLLTCSDGLWNYASEPEALAAQVRAAATSDPLALALALVAFANGAGGHDNITAALARVEIPGLGHNDQTPTPGGEPSDG